MKNKEKIFVIFMIFILIVLGITMFVGFNLGELSCNYSIVDNYLTLDKFNKIKTGMTYDDVVKIIGKNGTVSSDVNIGYEEYHTIIYTWDSTFGNMNVTFQNGKVIAKAQFGLK